MIFRSVTSRLVFSYCLLLLLLGGAFILVTIFSFRLHARETLNNSLAVRAREIWNTSEEFINQPTRLAQIIERRFSPQSQDRFIRIRVGGRTIYQSGDPMGREFVAAEVPSLDSAKKGPQTVLVGDLALYSHSFQASHVGNVTVTTGQSYRFARNAESRLAHVLFVGLPPLLLLAALAGYVLMRRALTPVEVMIKAAETYTFNNPHKRLPLVRNEPRIEALGLALNRMLDRLDSAYSHVSRFSADAAHELRTPLTIIRGELELIASGVRLPPDVDHAVRSALGEMTRLSGIVDSLITLSRMESMWGKRAHVPVDLTALAQETIDQLSLLAVEKHIALCQPAGPSVIVRGDRDRMKQALVNLLDNAIKYTPDGGQVTVETGIEDDMGFITVDDSGIGIDPIHHDKVFDRFYRVSPDRGEMGAGLGLAIVRSICHAHGGYVSLRSVPEIGSCFKIAIPVSAGSENTQASANAGPGHGAIRE